MFARAHYDQASYKNKKFYWIHDEGISRPHDENIIVRKCNGREYKARWKFLSDIGEPAHYKTTRKGIIFISSAEERARLREIASSEYFRTNK